MNSATTRVGSTAAFSLVEVALALGIAGFCLVGVVALLPIGLNTTQAAFSQGTAADIITHVLADLRAIPASVPPGGTTNSAEYSIPIPASAASGSSTTQTLYFGNSLQQFSFAPQSGASRYRLTVTFLPSTGDRTATFVTLQVTWPATLDPASSAAALGGRVQVVAALNRN